MQTSKNGWRAGLREHHRPRSLASVLLHPPTWPPVSSPPNAPGWLSSRDDNGPATESKPKPTHSPRNKGGSVCSTHVIAVAPTGVPASSPKVAVNAMAQRYISPVLCVKGNVRCLGPERSMIPTSMAAVAGCKPDLVAWVLPGRMPQNEKRLNKSLRPTRENF